MRTSIEISHTIQHIDTRASSADRSVDLEKAIVSSSQTLCRKNIKKDPDMRRVLVNKSFLYHQTMYEDSKKQIDASDNLNLGPDQEGPVNTPPKRTITIKKAELETSTPPKNVRRQKTQFLEVIEQQNTKKEEDLAGDDVQGELSPKPKSISHRGTIPGTIQDLLDYQSDGEARSPPKFYICEICFGSYSFSTKGPLLKCGHLFCNDCNKAYLEGKISFDTVLDIQCPKEGCNERFQPSHLQSVLDEKVFEKYKRLKKTAMLSQKPNLRWCVRPECKKYTIGKRGDEKVTCECGAEICFKCGAEYHPEKSCESILDVAYTKYAQENNIHTCPYCRCRIEKFDGCNHITCPICTYEWCWLCGKAYTPTHYSISNPRACSKLAKTDKKAYARPTLKNYCVWTFEALLFTIFFPFIVICLAIKVPTRQYDKYLDQKHGLNKGPETKNDNCFRLFLLILGIIILPITLIYLLIYRVLLLIKNMKAGMKRMTTNKNNFKEEEVQP